MDTYQHYVYAYLREDGTPYYIGKGKRFRAFDKHRIAVPPNKSQIVFLETNLSDVGALALERRYIRWYGRKDLCTGILRNMTDGGDGSSGFQPTEETRKKLSEAKRGRKGKKHSEETRKKLSEAKKGRKLSQETRLKMSQSKKGKPANCSMSGKKHSEETKRKMAAKSKGFSEYAREKQKEYMSSRRSAPK